jgi:hypothetical protein
MMRALTTVYTPASLAERWGCTAAQVHVLIRRGKLKAFSLGGRMTRIRSDSVEAFLDAGGVPPVLRNVPCDVYVVRSGQFIKIGKAEDPAWRIVALQAANPILLEVVAILTEGNGHSLELFLHHRFAAHRERGEWFRIEGPVAEWIEAGCPL